MHRVVVRRAATRVEGEARQPAEDASVEPDELDAVAARHDESLLGQPRERHRPRREGTGVPAAATPIAAGEGGHEEERGSTYAHVRILPAG